MHSWRQFMESWRQLTIKIILLKTIICDCDINKHLIIMYKIVQTTEKGKSQLCVVPEGWEINGILYWPKNKADRLIKDAKSTPGDNWFEMQCSVKRSNLITFDVAEEELENMLLCEDTDDCEQENRQGKKRQRVNLLPKTTSHIDFNNVAESCLVSNYL